MRLPGWITKNFSQTRHLIVHYHIFKNAGSTVDYILQQNFGEACGSYEGEALAFIVRAEELLKFTLDHPQLKAISSHNSRLPAPEHPKIKFYPLIFLRHPIDRIGSMYGFERKQPAGVTLTADFALQHSLAEYVQHFLQASSFFLKNYQTLHVVGKEIREKLKTTAFPEDLRAACEIIQGLEFFGIVDAFDEALPLMQDYLQKGFGKLDFNYAVINKTPGRPSTLADRLNEMEAQLGPALYQELLERNALDLELYEYARKLFDQRLAARNRAQTVRKP